MENPGCAILSEGQKIAHRMIVGYLHDSGYHVDVFDDRSSALKSIEECKYVLLLIDIDMQGLDVLSLLSHTHKISPKTSVVIITGHEKMDTAMQTLQHGAVDILVKPINLFYLDAALEKSVQHSRLVIDRMRALEDMEKAQANMSRVEQQNSELLKENERLRTEIQKLRQTEDT